MNKKQYNHVIQWTCKHDEAAKSEDSLKAARAIFKNMGVALPNGSMQEVFETIKTNDYMGWKSCTMEEAQQAADKGVPAIGIREDRIVILAAADEEKPVAQMASVMTLPQNNDADTVSAMQYYTYSYSTTEDCCVSKTVLFFAHDSLSVSVGWSGYNQLYGSGASTVYWTSSNTNVASVDYHTGLIHAKQGGVTIIAATTNDGSFVASCTVTVNYCGGEDYRDVTKHTMMLLDSGYYVCSKCGYKVKSPALQDREVLNDSDYYTIISLLHEFLSILQKYPIYAEKMLAMIDAIRGLPENRDKYEYCDQDGIYVPEYNIGFGNTKMYINVNKGSCVTEWVLFKALYSLISSAIPFPYSSMVSVICDIVSLQHPGVQQMTGADIAKTFASYLAEGIIEVPQMSDKMKGVLGKVKNMADILLLCDDITNGISCTKECYNINIVTYSNQENENLHQIKYHFSAGVDTMGRYSEYDLIINQNLVVPSATFCDNVNEREYDVYKY